MLYKDIEVVASDGTKLRGWLIYHKYKPEAKPTVLFMHENAGSIIQSLNSYRHRAETSILPDSP